MKSIFTHSLKLFTFTLISIFCTFTTVAQTAYVCNNCSSSDVTIKSVELLSTTPNPAYNAVSNPNVDKYLPLNASCSEGTLVQGYLKITIDQNAGTRYGLWVEGDIYVDGSATPSSSFSECDNRQFQKNGVDKFYVDNSIIMWTCGTTLALKKIFIGWGNSSGQNACSDRCGMGPHCSKPDANFSFVVITPLSVNFGYTSSCPSGKTAQKIDFNALDSVNGTSGGVQPYSYSWKIFKTSDLVTPIATLSGVTPSYDFSQAVAGPGEYKVTLTVVDSNSPATTASFSKTITVASCCISPTITSQPIDQTKCSGENAIFSVASSGGFPSPTIQWQVSTNNGGVWTDLAGQSNASLTLNSVSTSMNNYWYRAILTSGSCTPTISGVGKLFVNPSTGATSFTAGAVTVCQNAPNETYTATASNSTSIVYSVSPPAAGTIDPNTGVMNWDAAFSGTATITAASTGLCGTTTADRVVTVNPSTGVTSFTGGAVTVCQDAPNETYTATASNSTSIVYSVSPPAAGTIDPNTGVMNWDAAFSGTATITATSTGLCGTTTADRVVTVNPSTDTTSFTDGAVTVCQDAPNETYTATASNSTSIVYSVSPPAAGTIDPNTGVMNWDAAFSGTATITAASTGLCGTTTADRVVTVNPSTGVTSFTGGAVTVCQDAPNETYTATASNSTSIVYSVSPPAAGTIDPNTGVMNWDAAFSGTATITASSTGLCGTTTADRVVTVNPSTGVTSFTGGAVTVCQDAPNETYTATASNSTSIVYSVSPPAAGTIDPNTGVMNWDAAFSGTATITATSTGLCGTTTADRVVTVNPSTDTTSFTDGAVTVCQDAPNETYTATASNSTSIVYSVSPPAAGTIDPNTGVMNWDAAFSGTATITATSTGLCGTTTADRIVTVNPSTDTTSFTGGAVTVCQNAPNETYTATASNSTSIVYSVSPPAAGTIDPNTGVMNWDAAFSGTATITATSTGLCGTTTADRIVTVNPSTDTTSFTDGAVTVCQDAPNETYTATASNSTSIVYSVSPPAAGTIDPNTGVMNWDAAFSGTATITASSTGLCGTTTADRVVTVNPSTGVTSFTGGAVTVCQDAPNETYTATASNSTSIVYSVSPPAAGTIDPNTGVMNWDAAFSGTATITATSTGLCGTTTADRIVTVNPSTDTTSFTGGAVTVCQNAPNETYTATASNSTSIVYSVSPPAAGTIDPNTGVMNWDAAFSGTATITATSTGLCGTTTADRIVTVNPSTDTTSFTGGAVTVCQNAPNETYTATASNSTSIVYSVSPPAAGTIDPNTGVMNWDAAFSGTATITATSTGLCGTTTADRVVTVNPSTDTTSFTDGAVTVCQDAPNETYTATASNSTSIVYSVSPPAAGTIDPNTGVMNWDAAFSGTATITAASTGLCGTTTADRVVTVNPSIGVTSFTAGAVTVCQNAPNETYTATASNSTSIVYSVSPPAAGTIDPNTGVMNWDAAFSGTATITATSTGLCGTTTADRVVTVNPSTDTTSFTDGAVTVCQDAPNETYTATASNSTSIVYSVSPPAAGTIDPNTGVMNWDAAFSGTATITASSTGLCGTTTADRVVTVNPSTGVTSFTGGAVTVCQDAPNETYTATASNSTSIVYSVSPPAAGTIDPNTGVMNWDAAFSGTATITATSTGLCGTTTGDRVVTVNPLPTAIITGTTGVCKDATAPEVTFTGMNGTAPYTFTYNINGQGNLSISTTAGNSVTLAVPTGVTGSFIYNLISVQDSSTTTCSQAQTGTVTITVNSLPICSIAGSDDPICPSSSGNIYSAPAGMSNYSWSISGNATIEGDSSLQTVLVNAGINCGISSTLTLTIRDSNGCESTCTRMISIEDIVKPTFTRPADITIFTDASCQYDASPEKTGDVTDDQDNCSKNIQASYVDQVTNGNCKGAHIITRTWTLVDNCGNRADDQVQVITVEDNIAPIITQNASNVIIECDGQGNNEALTNWLSGHAGAIASDNCSDVTWTNNFDTITKDCSAAVTVLFTATDKCGNKSTTSGTFSIEDKTKPTWSTETASLDRTIECSDAQALTAAQALFPTAIDACDTSVSNLDKVSGEFKASTECGNAGTYTNTWTVTDACGNISEKFTQTITIQDTAAPTWSTEADSLNRTVECSDAQALAAAQALFPAATDACDTNVANLDKVSGEFKASQECGNAGTYINTWTVKDDCGNISETFTQIITIQDTTKPTFVGDLPSDSTVSCDAVPEPFNMEASDNCNGNLPIVFKEVKSDVKNECGTEYTLTRTWTTSDCGGNSISYTQVITVRDTTPPTGTAPSDVANLQSAADIPAGSPADIKDAADNCAGAVNITVSDTNNGGTGCNGESYILTRTYTLTDCAGNKTELVQTFTVENKVSVSGIATNVSCQGKSDGSIAVTSSPGSTVVITNQNNEVVGNTNLPAGTYTLTATSVVNSENETCTATATVVITEPNYKVKISGQIINIDTNTPIANVPVTLIPQGTTTGPILLRVTGADGMYSFTGMPAGDYLVQVQDANLNSAYQLYPVDSSLFFTTLKECEFQVHNFEYGKSTLPVLGDYVWYDVNGNGVQDEWYDANNDGVVTKNIPDAEGAIDYSLWEWIDFNGDGSYAGPANAGELNAGGFGNASNPNIIIDGPNGYHSEAIIGIQGFWRDRPEQANPYGEYNIKLVREANLDAVAAALGETGLVKVLPSSSSTDKKATSKPAKQQMHTVCQTTSQSGIIVNVTPEDLVHLDADFGVNCKEFKDIAANDDSAGPIAGVNHITTNVLNVLPNDTLEGVVVTASDVIITTVTPNEFLQLNSDGSVDVLANAPVGTLTLVYQICEADAASNCDTATVTVTIEAPVMTVTASPICINDVPYLDYTVTPVNFTPANGVSITWADAANKVVTTMTDLPLNGRVLWPGAAVDANGKGTDWPGWVFQNNQWIQAADGFEGLRPTANITVSVNPSETITVNYPPSEPFCTARPTFAIVANDDNGGPISGGTGAVNVVNVYTNDTLNGNAVNPADVTLTTVTPDPTGALTLNPNGSIDVKVGTTGGTYTLTYQICENADAGNCDTAIVTITVIDPAPPTPVDAVDDTYSNIGCNTFGLVGNVLSNDVKGAARATLELVNFTVLTETNSNVKTDPNITFDALGNVRVSSLTPAGTYTYRYRLCDKLSSENCDTATVTIIVLPNGVTNIASQACNDDSTLLNLSSLLPEGTPATGTWTDTNNTNALQGSTLNALGLALGTYIFEYRINDENCPRTIALNMEINDDCKVLPCGNIVVHNAFSPNGDGKNDVFVIDSIDDLTCYPGNTVEIYNRWGILVFETTNYNNETNAFDGTSRGRTTIKKSDGLPTGTYFYILNYKSLNGNNEVQNNKKDGYLYLSK